MPMGRKDYVAEPRRMLTVLMYKGHQQSRCCSPGNLWLWPRPPSLPGPGQKNTDEHALNRLQEVSEME